MGSMDKVWSHAEQQLAEPGRTSSSCFGTYVLKRETILLDRC